MSGARETVAKAVTLECMRGAVRQQRACFLYAFRSAFCVSENIRYVSCSTVCYLCLNKNWQSGWTRKRITADLWPDRASACSNSFAKSVLTPVQLVIYVSLLWHAFVIKQQTLAAVHI